MSAQSSGIGMTGALFLVFLVLKLTGLITWSWWWVTAPLWIAFGFWLGLLIIIGLLTAVIHWLDHRAKRRALRRVVARANGRRA